MIKIYRTKKWFPTVSHEFDTWNQKLVSQNFWNLQAWLPKTGTQRKIEKQYFYILLQGTPVIHFRCLQRIFGRVHS